MLESKGVGRTIEAKCVFQNNRSKMRFRPPPVFSMCSASSTTGNMCKRMGAAAAADTCMSASECQKIVFTRHDRGIQQCCIRNPRPVFFLGLLATQSTEGKEKPSPGQHILLQTQIRSRSRPASQAMHNSTSQTTFQCHPLILQKLNKPSCILCMLSQ